MFKSNETKSKTPAPNPWTPNDTYLLHVSVISCYSACVGTALKLAQGSTFPQAVWEAGTNAVAFGFLGAAAIEYARNDTKNILTYMLAASLAANGISSLFRYIAEGDQGKNTAQKEDVGHNPFISLTDVRSSASQLCDNQQDVMTWQEAVSISSQANTVVTPVVPQPL